MLEEKKTGNFFQGRHNSNRPTKKQLKQTTEPSNGVIIKSLKKDHEMFRTELHSKKGGGTDSSSSSGDFRGSHL